MMVSSVFRCHTKTIGTDIRKNPYVECPTPQVVSEQLAHASFS